METLVSVITTKREGMPIDNFVKSYTATCSNPIIAYTTDEPYVAHEQVFWSLPTQTWLECNQKANIYTKHTLNYYRPLLDAYTNNVGCLVFEDDILFQPNWLSYFLKAVECLEQTKETFILTLYSAGMVVNNGAHIPTVFKWDTSKLYDLYPLEHFFGTQAIYFSPTVIEPLLKYFYENSFRTFVDPTDLLIKRFCMDRGLEIHVCSYSLVQHSGSPSTGLGNHHYATNLLPAQLVFD